MSAILYIVLFYVLPNYDKDHINWRGLFQFLSVNSRGGPPGGGVYFNGLETKPPRSYVTIVTPLKGGINIRDFRHTESIILIFKERDFFIRT